MRVGPKPKKSLGQHFLINEGVLDKIAHKVFLESEEGQRPILEIGPGLGALTQKLLEKNLQVFAIEKDTELIATLQNKLPHLHLVAGDALKVSLGDIFNAHPNKKSWVLCGNLPYNVGTEILFRFLENSSQIKSFVCMLQKEVVLRMLSRGQSRDYGLPSLKWGWSCDFLDHFWVSPGSFSPPPKVESGVFVARRKTQPLADPLERNGLYDELSRLASRAFSQRRKMLRSAFPQLKGDKWENLRPENLSPEDFLSLPEKLKIKC